MMKNLISIPTSKRKQSWWGFFLISALLFTPLANTLAGVLVAPSVVILSDKGRTGRMTVQNPSNMPREITIDFSFGLPESDSLGYVKVKLDTALINDPRSAAPWIKAYPRKLVIPPSGSQVVRFVARPPADLPDGEYWARIMVQSQEGTSSLPSPTAEGKITTRLNMIMRTAIMLKYRSGNLVASLKLNNTTVFKNDTTIGVVVDMTNSGNVSYIGVLSCRLLDADQKEISTRRIQLAVYYDLKRRVSFRVPSGDFKAPFQVEVAISSRGRKDIPATDMIYGNEFSYTMSMAD